MKWTHENTIGIAAPACQECGGLGLRKIRILGDVPCACVLRAVFRACHARFKSCVSNQGHAGTVSLETMGQGRDTRRTYARQSEDFMADFCNVSRKALSQAEYKIFVSHFLLGADWKLCCKQLDISRGNFFHAVYRIEEKLGRAYAELEPYALYPVANYFNGPQLTPAPLPVPAFRGPVLRPPMGAQAVQA